MSIWGGGVKVSEDQTLINATFIHLEDDINWIDEVREYLTDERNICFSKYIIVDTISEAVHRILSTKGAIIFVVDIRLSETEPNFDGLIWLIDDLKKFLFERNNFFVFALSGQLNDATLYALELKGLDSNNIFQKKNWAEKKDIFCGQLLDISNTLESQIVAENLDVLTHETHIDSIIISAFENQIMVSEVDSTAENQDTELIFEQPMILQVNDENWLPMNIPDYKEISRIGDIVACVGSIRTVRALEKDTNVRRIERSHHSAINDCYESIPKAEIPQVHNDYAEYGDSAIVGIIDVDIDILHKAFRNEDGSSTRILAVWDQTDPTGPAPDVKLYNDPRFETNTMEIGTLYTQEDINKYIENNKKPKGLETDTNHGTHVSSIAAGRKTKKFYGGVAPDANIVVVIPNLVNPYLDLRRRGYYPNMGYSTSHIAALRFIKNIASQHKLPVCINVSLGTNGGAHDGNTPLEKAFDNATGGGRDPGCVIVKSAGNDRKSKIHARLKMASDSLEEVRLKVASDDPGPLSLEFWFESCDIFRFSFLDPDNISSGYVSPMERKVRGRFPSGNLYDICYTLHHPDNGDSNLLINLWSGELGFIKNGSWTLIVESSTIKSSSGEINGWIERNNNLDACFDNHFEEEMTISVPGTAETVITVGSIKKEGGKPFLSEFSAYGPTRNGNEKPDLVAPGECIWAASANTGFDITNMSGTSMAAPHVSGTIALLLSYWNKKKEKIVNWEQFNANQIRSVLQQSCKNYRGAWNRGQGYGVIDAYEFFKILCQ